MREADHLNLARSVLKIGLEVGPVIAGIDKFFDKLADWSIKKDHLRVNVSGDLQGDTLKVTSITLL